MQPQLFMSRHLPVRSDRIEPIKNMTLKESIPVKPHGGLWTSTLIEGQASDWLFAYFMMFGLPPAHTRYFVVHPSASANLLVIDTLIDLIHATEKYPHYAGESIGAPAPMFTYLDFEAISKDYDGVHLTCEGQARTRLSYPFSLYGWDCESTLWFKWCFEHCEEISLPAGKLYDLYNRSDDDE